MPGDSTAAILQRRAAALARRPETVADRQPSTDVVVVGVAGGVRYAVETRFVRQVVATRSASALPRSPGALIALVQVRDEAVPVADLGALTGLAAPDPTRPFTVVLGVDEPPVGVLVDEVVSTEALADVRLRSAPGASAGGSGLEAGVTADGVVLLDGRALLDDDRLHIPDPSGRHLLPDRPPPPRGEP